MNSKVQSKNSVALVFGLVVLAVATYFLANNYKLDFSPNADSSTMTKTGFIVNANDGQCKNFEDLKKNYPLANYGLVDTDLKSAKRGTQDCFPFVGSTSEVSRFLNKKVNVTYITVTKENLPSNNSDKKEYDRTISKKKSTSTPSASPVAVVTYNYIVDVKLADSRGKDDNKRTLSPKPRETYVPKPKHSPRP